MLSGDNKLLGAAEGKPMLSRYNTILIDPPWPQRLAGKRQAKHAIARELPYPTMTLDQIKQLPIQSLSAPGCHLWLWTTNQFLRDGFDLVEHWGFKYLAPIVWVKPSGFGNYFIHRTQTLLSGYKQFCRFKKARYVSNLILADKRKHSQKPLAAYGLIESISLEPRLEMFARNHRDGWDAWGNEVSNSVEIAI